MFDKIDNQINELEKQFNKDVMENFYELSKGNPIVVQIRAENLSPYLQNLDEDTIDDPANSETYPGLIDCNLGTLPIFS